MRCPLLPLPWQIDQPSSLSQVSDYTPHKYGESPSRCPSACKCPDSRDPDWLVGGSSDDEFLCGLLADLPERDPNLPMPDTADRAQAEMLGRCLDSGMDYAGAWSVAWQARLRFLATGGKVHSW